MAHRCRKLRATLLFALCLTIATLFSTSVSTSTAFAAQPASFPVTVDCDQTTSLLGATSFVVDLTDGTSVVAGGVSKGISNVLLTPIQPVTLTTAFPNYPSDPGINYSGQLTISVPAGISAQTVEVSVRIRIFDIGLDVIGDTTAAIVCGAEQPTATATATDTATATTTATLTETAIATNTATATIIPDPTSTLEPTATWTPEPAATSTSESISTSVPGPVVTANDFAISLTVNEGSASGSFADHTTSSGPATYGLVSAPQFGTVSFDPATGTFTYTLNNPTASGFSAAAIIENDSFTYSASVGEISDSAIVSVVINGSAASPIAPPVASDPPVISLPSTGTGGSASPVTYMLILAAFGCIMSAGLMVARRPTS